MIKNFLKRIYNLHVIISLAMLILVYFACKMTTTGLTNVYRKGFEEKKQLQVSGYASRMSNQLTVTDYLNSANRTIENEFDIVAEIYHGRIIVISSSLNVLYDTYSRAEGKTAINPAMIKAMQGENNIDFDWKTEYGSYAYGITGASSNSRLGVIYIVFSIEDEANTLRRIARNSNIFTLLIMIIVILISNILLSMLIRSSRKNKKNLEKISSGNYDAKLDENGIWEFRSTAYAVNEMLEKVKATEESQREFVSDVSHELKTPMASMKVLAESLLSQEYDDPAIYREFLSDINETIDRENRIIQDLLLLVKMDKKADTLNTSLCSMNEILEVVIKRVKPLAEEKKITVIFESYREIKAEVDDSKLIMALTNIVENGVKYNVDNGELRIGLNSDSGYVYITIEDSGIGISDEAQKHIFDRFYRVDKARARQTGGTGLGLAIANDVVKLHGGEIKVFSREGMGTSFTIRLPISSSTESVKIIEEVVK
ncbi:MAG: two-component sensor histidine kinase [Lachnospiraceae bacterium]|nr:two-component sensor histidine kinase [Lachnospiraceae bacterium]